jgi:hypothetical protein
VIGDERHGHVSLREREMEFRLTARQPGPCCQETTSSRPAYRFAFMVPITLINGTCPSELGMQTESAGIGNLFLYPPSARRNFAG